MDKQPLKKKMQGKPTDGAGTKKGTRPATVKNTKAAPTEKTAVKKSPKAKIKNTGLKKEIKGTKPKVKKKVPVQPKATIKPKPNPNRVYISDQFYNKLPFMRRLGARLVLGLDIDADKIRYTVSKNSRDDCQIVKWGVQKFPSEEKDRRKALQIALENVVTKAYKRSMQVQVSIFSPEISSRQIILPEMKKQSDLEKAIYNKNEIEVQNFDERSIWTYEILDTFESEGIRKHRIAILAAPEEVINEYTRVFDAVGLEVNQLISRPTAIQFAYRRMVFRPGRDLLIDIGYDLTQMCFIKNGYVEFVRNVSIGSRNLEVTIHNRPEEKQFKKPGLKSAGGDVSEQQPDQVRSRLLSRIKDLKTRQNPVLHTFFSEILRSLAFFQGKDVQQYIERIFVTGYGIRKEALLPYLKSRLHIPLFILTPQFEDRDIKTIEFSEYFSTLGTTAPAKKSVNLLPEKYKNRFLFKRMNAGLAGLLIVLVGVLGMISKSQIELIEKKKETIASYKQEYQTLNPIEGKYQEVLELISDVNQKNTELKSYIKTRPPIIELLRLLSNEVPVGIRLEKIDFVKLNVEAAKKKFQNDYKFQIDINGVITIDPLMSDVVLINFVNHLIELKYFKHIELLNKLKETDLKITRFGIRLYM